MRQDDDELWEVYASDAHHALQEIEESLLRLEQQPGDVEELNRLYRALHTLKGNSGFLRLAQVERLAHAAEGVVSGIRDGSAPLTPEWVDLLLSCLDALRRAVDHVASARADIPATWIEGLVARLRPAERGTQPEFQLFEEDEAPAPAPSAMPDPSTVPSARGAKAELIRVDAAKIAAVMDLAGEIGLACGAVTQHPELQGLDLAGFSSAAHKLEALVRELQNEVSALRLVPIAGVFQRMQRVVRDCARRTGKEVELILVGEETEIDKVMVDAIQDPLTHALRNAVDHGIEPPDVRRQAGKSRVGRIVLAASHAGGEVAIEIHDDGQGLDRAGILKRARERGLVAPDAELEPAAIDQLIFRPGFSTKAVADELSGRGVGMDVVWSTIERLRGGVQLDTEPGRGTRLRLTVPLTMAFIDAMVVRERDRLYALPTDKVLEVLRPEADRLITSDRGVQDQVRVRGRDVPILWLHDFYGEVIRSAPRLDEHVLVVIQGRRGDVAVPVNHILGNQQIMLKPLAGVLGAIRGAAGYGMLRTGDVALTLDCDQVMA